MSSASDSARRTRVVESLRGAGDWLQLVPRPAAWALVVAWLGLIWWLSSQPSDPTPGPWWLSVLWNGGHAPIYGLLALWLALALPRHAGWPKLDRRGVLSVLALVLASGVLDEFHQSTTSGRDFSALDLLTDLAGAACVLWIATFLADDRADDGGLARRVIAGIALCTLAALSATFVGQSFRELAWL
ncbi:MAG: VanZ family protein [Planctomycetes bacterium]|nr:VanZ family protein [Planctomycetota bacterium]